MTGPNDEQLLAAARNLRAGLLKALDYDDEVATIYNVLLFAVRPLRSQLRDLTEELEREKCQLVEALRRADAAEMALADVRTLDEWALGGRTWKCWRAPTFAIVLVQLMSHAKRFDGTTLDAVRAKAAAWVRERATEPAAQQPQQRLGKE